MYKILFLQPKEYFDALGVKVDTKHINPDYGPWLLSGIEKKLKKYSLLISCIDHSKTARNIINCASRLQIPSLFLMDGIYDEANATSHPFLKKKGIVLLEPCVYSCIATLTHEHAQKMESFGTPCIMYTPTRALPSPLHSTSKQHVDFLVTTARTAYFSESERQKVCLELIKVCNSITSLGAKFSLRILDKHILSELPKELSTKNSIEKSLIESIESADIVISTPSTVLYTAWELNKKTINLNYRKTQSYFKFTDELLGDENPIQITTKLIKAIEAPPPMAATSELRKTGIVITPELIKNTAKPHHRPTKSKTDLIFFDYISRLVYQKLKNLKPTSYLTEHAVRIAKKHL